jgi:hypothetical protein
VGGGHGRASCCARIIAMRSIPRCSELWNWINARTSKRPARKKVAPVWDTRDAVAANLDARAARTGPGQRVPRSLQKIAKWLMSKPRPTARRKGQIPTVTVVPSVGPGPGPATKTNSTELRPATPNTSEAQRSTDAPARFAFVSKSRHRQKRLRLAEAMRQEGLDEPAVARATLELVDKLLGGGEPNGSEKLLLDSLKEISRTLEPQGSSGPGAGLAASDAPMIVQLVHDVPRPSRPRANQAGYESIGADEEIQHEN